MDSGDLIVRSIGKFGRWQLFIIIVIFLSKFAVAWHLLIVVIASPPANFTCSDPSLDQCASNCTEHEFDKSLFSNTIVMEWDLVCNHAWLANLSQTFVMLGILIGNYVFGLLADKFGRKRPLVLAIIIQVVSGTLAGFVPSLPLYMFFRFLSTVATGGTMLTAFVLLMEFTAKKYRTIVGVLFQLPFNLGHASLGLIGYYFRDWRYSQVIVSLPSAVLISYWCILPESPRWLLTKNRTDDTVKMLESAATCNKLPIEPIRPDVEQYVAASAENPVETGNTFDLVRTKRMRTKTLCLSFNWLVISMTFYGFAQYMGQIGGNIFINVAAAGLIEIPGNFLAIWIMDRFGRKASLICGYIICFVPCFVIIFLPSVPAWPTSLMGCIGVMGIFMTFSIIYVYTGEMYPTVIRNIGMGITSMAGRVGSMISPFITQLSVFQSWLPAFVFAIFPILGALATIIFLPETLNVKMPDKIEDADKL